mmetsp:Transcript_23482/g.48876  ORF Transcript_23482/g.48876 Transcript_23482/m.48876 type:complete len:788 (+) Transcript_23482:160-2523(+)
MERRVSSRVQARRKEATEEADSSSFNPTDVRGPLHLTKEGSLSSGSSISTTSSTSSDNGGHRRGSPFDLLYQEYGSELANMVAAFDKLERELRVIPGSEKTKDQIKDAEQRHTKLLTFIKHLRRAQDQLLSGAAPGQNEEHEAALLEKALSEKLMPVYERLKKQKGDSKGAKTNPKGAPVNHPVFNNAFKVANNGPPISVVKAGPPAPSIFGAPLKGGSFLTQKLHGSTLGSDARRYGDGVGTNTPVLDNTTTKTQQHAKRQRHVLHGGMTPGSETVMMPPPFIAGLSDRRATASPTRSTLKTAGEAAAAASRVVVSERKINTANVNNLGHSGQGSSGSDARDGKNESAPVASFSDLAPRGRHSMNRLTKESYGNSGSTSHESFSTTIEQELLRGHLPQQVLNLGEKEFPLHPPKAVKKPRKKRRKESPPVIIHNQVNDVEYLCAECDELYTTTTTANPWWVVVREECPKCHKLQIPRIDINLPTNAINYHPALVAHENDEDNEGGHHHLVFKGPIDDSNKGMSLGVGVADGEDESESDSDSDTGEDFGEGYKGPTFTTDEASRLAKLFQHARTCPGRHKNPRHMEVCQSVKFMMLHIRDCAGTVLTNPDEPCPFPWCRKAKHLVYHVASCDHPESCEICDKSPSPYLSGYRNLAKLNTIRLTEEKFRVKSKKQEEEEKKREEKEVVGEGGKGVMVVSVKTIDGITVISQDPAGKSLAIPSTNPQKVVSDGDSDEANSIEEVTVEGSRAVEGSPSTSMGEKEALESGGRKANLKVQGTRRGGRRKGS